MEIEESVFGYVWLIRHRYVHILYIYQDSCSCVFCLGGLSFLPAALQLHLWRFLHLNVFCVVSCKNIEQSRGLRPRHLQGSRERGSQRGREPSS